MDLSWGHSLPSYRPAVVPSGRLFLEQPAVAGCAKPNVHPRRGPRPSALPDSALPFVTLCFFMQAARLLHNASPPRTPNQLPAFLNPLPVNRCSPVIPSHHHSPACRRAAYMCSRPRLCGTVSSILRRPDCFLRFKCCLLCSMGHNF